ncbi:uncharacterized protein LOC135072684 [Ostrinia nubilalis]|uniref:uncharacterized protein LOC135072684 n=1 Tax=Ostrinia nubilalis TaxID=29057 RepID=UPI0030822BDA
MRTLLLIYFATLVQCEYKGDFVKHVRHGGRTLIRHGRSRVHFSRMHSRARDLVAQVIEAERSSELESIDKSGEDPVVSALRPYGAPDDDDGSPKDSIDTFQKFFGNISQISHPTLDFTTEDVSLLDHLLNVEHSYNNDTQRMTMDDVNTETNITNETLNEGENVTVSRPSVHEDVVTKFLRLIETQHLLGENCTAGTHLNLGEGVVDRYAQERFRIEADVAVNRANMLTRLWKYAGSTVMHNEYLLHASVFSMVEFDDDIFAAGNCYDQYQYKDYQLFCPFAYRLPEGPILAKDLAVEYKYLSNTSEWFYIARKNAERVIRNHNQFRRGEW